MKRWSCKLMSVTGIVLIAMFALTRAARAAVYTFATLNDPSGAVGTTHATGINDNNEIVEYYADSNGAYHGFAYSDGTYHEINEPGAGTAQEQGTEPGGIDDHGDIVGFYIDSSGNKYGFLYSSATGAYTPLGNLGLTAAAGINDNGYFDATDSAPTARWFFTSGGQASTHWRRMERQSTLSKDAASPCEADRDR